MPSPGDLSLCFKCGEWTVFDQDLKHRKPMPDEYDEIAESEMCRQMRRAWVEMIALGPRTEVKR
jgi:hypothetical protein